MTRKRKNTMFKKDLKIVYLGTPKISAIVLENLIKNGYKIVAVVSQADKPQGRKMILTPTETKLVAQKYNIRVVNNFLKKLAGICGIHKAGCIIRIIRR